jgi:hypothetical protein
MKLYTNGDSIAQGFMSLAAARTELSFSTLIARCFGLAPGVDYLLPAWGAGGIPINIERLLRTLERLYGSDISGVIEWPSAVVTINQMMDEVEDYYERGPGNIALPQAGPTQWFPNVAVAGFTIADAWLVTPRWCLRRIASEEAERGLFTEAGDGFFALPNRRFERTAHAVLNPSRSSDFNDFSQLQWLKFHVEREGIENVLLWLGSNNALGTVVRLRIAETGSAPKHPLEMTVDERNPYNLWTPQHFEDEYDELLRRVHEILSSDANRTPDCKVFVATVPPVTIAPLAKGVGGELRVPDPFGVVQPSAIYYEYYTFVIFGLDYARRGHRLTQAEALHIDRYIAQYNASIRSLVDKYNTLSEEAGRGVQYIIVDIANQLLRLAFKRNNGQPTYPMPPEVLDKASQLGRPVVSTAYYHVDRRGVLQAGGVFSLDGVHPTAIGQGLIAHEFIQTLEQSGVAIPRRLDWDAIFASDSLYANPISLMPELYENTRLADMLLDLLSLP